MSVQGLQKVLCTYSPNGGYWHARPGCFYICDATGGPLVFKLAPTIAYASGDQFSCKIVGGVGNNATFQAPSGEKINGMTAVALQQAGQGLTFTVNGPGMGYTAQ